MSLTTPTNGRYRHRIATGRRSNFINSVLNITDKHHENTVNLPNDGASIGRSQCFIESSSSHFHCSSVNSRCDNYFRWGNWNWYYSPWYRRRFTDDNSFRRELIGAQLIASPIDRSLSPSAGSQPSINQQQLAHIVGGLPNCTLLNPFLNDRYYTLPT